MMGFGVVTPYHCWNGFFMRGQFTAIFPKHIFNATLDLAKDYIKTASNQALALGGTGFEPVGERPRGHAGGDARWRCPSTSCGKAAPVREPGLPAHRRSLLRNLYGASNPQAATITICAL